MAARDVLKNFAAWVDGKGYAGQVEEYNPPDLSLQVEDFRAGGMNAPIALDMGQEALETSIGLASYDADILALWGVAPGRSIPLTVRGAVESYDGTVGAVVHSMRGKITTMARGAWQAGQKPSLTITMRLDYYREERDGAVITEIDVINMVRIVGGVDQLAAQRAAMGL